MKSLLTLLVFVGIATSAHSKVVDCPLEVDNDIEGLTESYDVRLSLSVEMVFNNKDNVAGTGYVVYTRQKKTQTIKAGESAKVESIELMEVADPDDALVFAFQESEKVERVEYYSKVEGVSAVKKLKESESLIMTCKPKK